MGVYRIVREDGSVEFTDVPPEKANFRQVRPGEPELTPEEQRRQNYERGNTLRKEAQKRIPKLPEYLDYISYLRTSSPAKFDYVMRELKRTDIQTWLKLQKYPQFRPLSETVVGVKAGENMIGLGIGSVTGNFSGSFEKFAETTLKSMMKRDGWSPEVLGAKATTLAPPPKPSYSSSPLGQWLQKEDAALARGGAGAAAEMEAGRAAMRAGVSSALVRFFGPVLDTGMAALNPDTHAGFANFKFELQLKRALGEGLLTEDQYLKAHNLMSQGRYKEMADYLQSVTKAPQ